MILEEIAMHDDDPTDAVHDEFAAALFGDAPLGRPILGTVESISEPRPATASPATTGTATSPPNLVVGRRRQHRPRRGRAAGRRPRSSGPSLGGAGRPRRRSPGSRARARHVDPGVRSLDRPTEQANVVLGTHRHGPHRRAAVRARRAQRGPRRRHVLAAVPGDPREARAGVLGLQLHLPVRRHRHVRRLRRLPARRRSTRCSTICREELAKVAAERHHRRGARPRQGPAARRRSCSAWRTPARG